MRRSRSSGQLQSGPEDGHPGLAAVIRSLTAFARTARRKARWNLRLGEQEEVAKSKSDSCSSLANVSAPNHRARPKGERSA